MNKKTNLKQLRVAVWLVAACLMAATLTAQNRVPGRPGMYPKLIDLKDAPVIFKKGNVLLADDQGSMRTAATTLLKNSYVDGLGMEHYRYQQSFAGIPVEDAEYIVHVRDGKVVRQNGEWVKDFPAGLATRPALSQTAALEKALGFVAAKQYKWQLPAEEARIKRDQNNPAASFYPRGQLVYYSGNNEVEPSALHLAYKFDVYAQQPLSRQFVFVSAETGKLLGKKELMHSSNVTGTAKTAYSGEQTITTDLTTFIGYRLRETTRGNGINTYNNNNSYLFQDFTDADNYWDNVNPALDQYATDAHWAAEKTYDFFKERFNRNSIDNAGYALNSYVHTYLITPTQTDNANAFWDGSNIYYGDGNSTIKPLTALDIAGHEIAHGLTSKTAKLNYKDESGALNEAFSDIFGTAIEFYARPSRANWTIGEDIGITLRSMSNPKLFHQPNTYKGDHWYTGADDNGGVHINSGVLNYWFYLLAQGGSGTNDLSKTYTVAGIGIDKAAAIAYRLLTVYLTSTSNYADARILGMMAAVDLYGINSTEAIATANAFYAVGIEPTCVPGFANDITGNGLSFDGTDDYVEVRPDAYFKGDFTIEAWIYPRSFNTWSRILDFGNGAGINNVVLSMTSGTNGFPTLRVEGKQFQSSAALTLNSWNHVAATLSGTQATIYINGAPAGTAVLERPVNITRQYCYLGRSNWPTDGYANAIFDEIRIWNTARSQTDIQAAMNGELAGNEPGLQVYYNFNEGILYGANTGATILVDKTNGVSSGVLKNFTLSGANNSNWAAGKAATATANIWAGSLLQLNSAESGLWSTNAAGVAQVSSSGLVTAGTAGTAKIAIKTGTNACTRYATTNVTVTALPVISGTGTICKLGETTTLSANVPGGEWTSSNTDVATVNISTGLVTGAGAGTCTVYYTVWLNGYKKETSTTVKVANLTPDWKMSSSLVYSFTAKQNNCTYQWYYDNSAVAFATTKSFYLSFVYDYKRVGLRVKDNSTGCTAARNAPGGSGHIHITDIPTASASATSICQGTPVVLSTTQEGDNYYVWSTNADGTGVVESDTVITVTPSITTTYYLTAVDADGHGVTDGGTTITVNNWPANGTLTGNGLDFDGVNDYVAVPVTTNIPIGNATYSIEAWVKPTLHTSNGIVGWGNWGTTNQTTSLRLGDNYTVRNGWYNTELTVSSGNLADGKWHHIAATFDGATRKIYVDGVLKGQDNPTGHNVPYSNNLKIGSIGIPALGNVQNFQGSMDEVRIWNIARTQAQVLAAMNTELTGTETGLVACYNFNQGKSGATNTGITTLTDKTANGNKGLLTNFALSGATSNWVAGSSFPAAQTTANKLNFDGVNDYVSVPNNIGVPDGNSHYTIEALIKPAVHGTNGIAGWGNWWSIGGTNALRLGQNNTIHNYWWSNDLVVNSGNLADGLWHHVAASFDGTTRKIYVDGVLKGQDNPTGHNVTNTSNLAIGVTFNTEYFNGSLDEVRIWNIARTQSQLQAAMLTELGATDTAGLRVYYNFNQGVAGGANTGLTSLANKQGPANNGTLNNFALSGGASNWVNNTSGTTAAEICTGNTLQLNSTVAGGAWGSTNSAVASVSSTGLVTALAAGTAVISYTVANANGCAAKAATTTITVKSCVLDGYVYLIQNKSSGLVAETNSTATGVQLYQNNITSSNNQLWRAKSLGGNTFTFTNLYNGLVWEAQGNSNSIRTPIVTNNYNAASLYQQWVLKDTLSGHYTIQSKGNKYFAEIAGGQITPNGLIRLFSINSINQVWNLIPSVANNPAVRKPENLPAPATEVVDRVRVYPNPARDRITVQLPADMQAARLTLVDANGLTVAGNAQTGLLRVMQLTHVAKGSYLLKVDNGHKTLEVQKIVVE